MNNHRSTIVGFAILIVLMGAGAAQGLAGSNTVFTDDIVDGQVAYSDIRDGAMTGKKILDNSVTGVDINPARQTVIQPWAIAPLQTQFGTAQCPVGKTATGGGFTQENDQMAITDSYRSDSRTWVVFAHNNSLLNDLGLDVYVICDAL